MGPPAAAGRGATRRGASSAAGGGPFSAPGRSALFVSGEVPGGRGRSVASQDVSRRVEVGFAPLRQRSGVLLGAALRRGRSAARGRPFLRPMEVCFICCGRGLSAALRLRGSSSVAGGGLRELRFLPIGRGSCEGGLATARQGVSRRVAVGFDPRRRGVGVLPGPGRARRSGEGHFRRLVCVFELAQGPSSCRGGSVVGLDPRQLQGKVVSGAGRVRRLGVRVLER